MNGSLAHVSLHHRHRLSRLGQNHAWCGIMLDTADGRRLAVIVNEFGELGIDGEILKAAPSAAPKKSQRLVELANGCLCCTVADEFFPVMRELIARHGASTTS